MLTKLQKQKTKLEDAGKKDPERGKSLAEKQAWKNVLEKASGAKVRDDEDLLKKAAKKKEKIKKAKEKKWKGRIQKVSEGKEQRQKKRTENIKIRKQAKKQKKIKRAVKKGRILPELKNVA